MQDVMPIHTTQKLQTQSQFPSFSLFHSKEHILIQETDGDTPTLTVSYSSSEKAQLLDREQKGNKSINHFSICNEYPFQGDMEENDEMHQTQHEDISSSVSQETRIIQISNDESESLESKLAFSHGSNSVSLAEVERELEVIMRSIKQIPDQLGLGTSKFPPFSHRAVLRKLEELLKFRAYLNL